MITENLPWSFSSSSNSTSSFPHTSLIMWWFLHQKDFYTHQTPFALIRVRFRSMEKWWRQSMQVCWCRSMVSGQCRRCCFCWILIDFISKSQPFLRSFYVLMIIQYLNVRTQMRTFIRSVSSMLLLLDPYRLHL